MCIELLDPFLGQIVIMRIDFKSQILKLHVDTGDDAAAAIDLVPDNAAGPKWIVEVIASPDNLLFRYPDQFVEIFRGRD